MVEFVTKALVCWWIASLACAPNALEWNQDKETSRSGDLRTKTVWIRELDTVKERERGRAEGQREQWEGIEDWGITSIAERGVQQTWPSTMRETREWRLGEGQVGLEGWISFLWGTDLQSRSGTGTPFNQRYSNCIGWPLPRVSLGDFTWLTRVQDFEDIMGSRHDSVGVWEPRAIR